MSKHISKTTKWVLILLIISNIIWLKYSYNQKGFPYQQIVTIFKKISVLKKGKDKYVEKKLSYKYVKNSTSGYGENIIETSVLPLTKKYTSLVSKKFPASGGSIAIAEGKVLILDRFGRIYLFNNGSVKKLNFKVPNNINEYVLNYEGNAKLHGDAFRSHCILYDTLKKEILVSFTRFEGGANTRLIVASLSIDTSDFTKKEEWETIFKSQTLTNQADVSHAGGGKMILREDSLFLFLGYDEEKEKNKKWYSKSLDDNTLFGKVLLINRTNKKVNIFSKGHRNAQGLAFLNDGRIISTEHGPQGGDEINIIQEDGNYGWPIRTYGTRYGTYDYNLPLESMSDSQNLIEPLLAFVPSIGVSPILQVNNFHPRWKDDLLVGSLKAQTLYRIKIVDNRVVFQEPIWIGHRIRDIIELKNKLIILTDDANIITLSVNNYALAKNSKGSNLIAMDAKLSKCVQCHQFTPTTPNSLAPSLSNIYNRKIGSDTYTRYSGSLKNYEGKWDEKNLIKFIQNPNKLIPGSMMPNLGLSPQEVNDIVTLLKSQ